MSAKLRVFLLLALFAICQQVAQVSGHGMLLDPPGRSSRWRYDSSAPINYNDNALYCGGFSTHHYTNGGNCGLCGDNYADTPPRANELGGKYGGTGVITKTYTSGSLVTLGAQITANHKGYLSYQLCNYDKFGKESEECFAEHRLLFADGSDKYYIGSSTGYFPTSVRLPLGIACNHCVLRWTYTAGNNWGYCDDGTGTLGCGPQETFKSCADIKITA